MVDKDTVTAKDLILSGSELAGTAIGGAIGFFAGGPGAAALLSVSGAAITRVLSITAQKYMAQRERVRVGSVAAICTNHINARFENGDSLRVDLFKQNEHGSSSGEQLLEGVLLKARDAYEEKKLPYLGYFCANILFEPTLSSSAAFHLLGTLERISYRQIVLISLLHNSDIDMEHVRAKVHIDPELETFKREEMNLHKSDFGTLGLIEGEGPWVDTLSNLGKLIAQLGNFDQIPQGDKDDVKNLIESARDSQ
jgi:hypothetical protein